MSATILDEPYTLSPSEIHDADSIQPTSSPEGSERGAGPVQTVGGINSLTYSSGWQRDDSARAQKTYDDGMNVEGQIYEEIELADLHGTVAENAPPGEYAGEDQTTRAQEQREKIAINAFPKNKYRILSSAIVIFALGLNDGVIGALVPYMESYYGINYSIVSLVWLANSLGFITIAISGQYIYTRVGRAVMIAAGPLFLTTMYAVVGPAPVYPVVATFFFFGGVGMALILAQVNVFLSYLEHTEQLYGFVHGAYGIGATVSPLIATAMASSGIKWSYFYFILMAYNLSVSALCGWSFKGCDRDIGTSHFILKNRNANIPNPSAIQSSYPVTSDTRHERSVYHDALHDKVSWIATFFIFFYQGAETTIGGWIVSFMIETRNGDASKVGYVSAGYWAGIAIGRLVLNQVLSKILKPRTAIYVLLGLVIAFDLMAWLIPNIIGGAVAVAIVGLFVGPIFPSAITTINDLLPRKTQSFTLTLTTAFGSTGAAIWPFVAGLLSESHGIWIVHPLAISLFGSMLVLWYFLPAQANKRD
ncbi:major facilitator superfamily domain-containing protein [Myxozyma melibiosi]|uniref:Major facilitator superfamily domain-containing protein n=1 Tax=Myxozyma melibiosi TaxID=54550 RepID=A0ABR1F5M7_9ASCO